MAKIGIPDTSLITVLPYSASFREAVDKPVKASRLGLCTKKLYSPPMIEAKREENTRGRCYRPEHRLGRPQRRPKDHRHPPRLMMTSAVAGGRA
jgi:hypothetical protein